MYKRDALFSMEKHVKGICVPALWFVLEMVKQKIISKDWKRYIEREILSANNYQLLNLLRKISKIDYVKLE